MFRYYISFAHQKPTGIGIGTVDISTDKPVSRVEDLTEAVATLTARGFQKVQILAFSRYAEPTDENPARPTGHAAAATSGSRRPRR